MVVPALIIRTTWANPPATKPLRNLLRPDMIWSLVIVVLLIVTGCLVRHPDGLEFTGFKVSGQVAGSLELRYGVELLKS